MYKGLTISMVIPAYNEERLIADTISAVPYYVDKIYVIDDGSVDNTCSIVKRLKLKDDRVELVQHEVNRGPGAAIVTGYEKSASEGYDATVVIVCLLFLLLSPILVIALIGSFQRVRDWIDHFMGLDWR